MFRAALLTIVTLMSCKAPYAGPNCEALTPGRSVDGLPISRPSAPPDVLFKWSDPLISGTDELRCCAFNVEDERPDPAWCAALDCDALRERVQRSSLGGPFADEPCGPRVGVSRCTAVIEDGRLVGVYAFCFD